MAKSTLPPQAFDGQIFIDAFRVKWQFDGSTKCWVKVGICSDIPVVSEFQPGLLSAKFKQLLDGIPDRGGHFGIITQPLLSIAPKNQDKIYKDHVVSVLSTKSGTSIKGKLVDDRKYTPEQFVGKILIFKTGVLTKKAFLIFTNDEEFIYVEGDATAASVNDKFEIVDSNDFNPNGVLIGDIMFVSDTIDITCVDGDGGPLIGDNSCNVDVIYCDNVSKPPGLNFQLNKDFLDSLCVVVPGCKGPRGDKGDKGDKGLDGTGDGPKGDPGDPGDDASTAGIFTGIKIIDIDDIYDTAVVSMELDAENGKLNVIKAKVRTPDSSTPATRLISMPINRSIKFLNEKSFDYELLKPNVDPIEELDVDILKYPQQYSKPQGNEIIRTTNIEKMKLSEVLNAVFKYYEERLAEINESYNRTLKEYIERKDADARTILANLAQELAFCEFELPIEFCLGISPSDCNQNRSQVDNTFDFPLSSLIISYPTDVDPVDTTATSLGFYRVPAFSIPDALPLSVSPGEDTYASPDSDPATLIDPATIQSLSSDPFIAVMYPNNTTESATQILPAGHYVIKINKGFASSSSSDGYVVGTGDIDTGFQAVIQYGDTSEVKSASSPSVPYNNYDSSSVELAYQISDFQSQIITVELPEPGKIYLCMPLSGSNVQGAIEVEVFKLNVPSGAEFIA